MTLNSSVRSAGMGVAPSSAGQIIGRNAQGRCRTTGWRRWSVPWPRARDLAGRQIRPCTGPGGDRGPPTAPTTETALRGMARVTKCWPCWKSHCISPASGACEFKSTKSGSADRRRRSHAACFERATGGYSLNLTISGHHLEVTPALNNYVKTKLDRITATLTRLWTSRCCSLWKQEGKRHDQRAGCNIHVKGSDLFAESSISTCMPPWMNWSTSSTARLPQDRLQDHHHDAPSA